LTKYFDSIVLNTTKSIRALEKDLVIPEDGSDYKSISTSIVEFHMYPPEYRMTMGDSLTDSRGRAICSSLSKVFNPIGYKDARSHLVHPEGIRLGLKGLGNVFLFISELLGLKPETVEEKANMGRWAYEHRKLHKLDLSKQSDRDELHENIWLERIYDNLDIYSGVKANWTVPIEIDMTACVLVIEGALLNDYRMWDETNAIKGDKLKDVWSKGMPRKQFKFASTPLLYGSTQECTTLWRRKKIDYTLEQVKLHRKELAEGVLGLSNDLKDYIIDNVSPKPKMSVKIMDEEFTVYCNRYHNLGEYTKKYPLYDTASSSVLSVNHKHTKRIADLDQFRRYFVTLLVHNLDSQILDKTVAKLEWSIPIYDAIIVMPNEADTAKEGMAKGIDEIRAKRESILRNFFDSIGIQKSLKNIHQWIKLQQKVTPMPEDIVADTTVMK